jgi:hypothetical protein
MHKQIRLLILIVLVLGINSIPSEALATSSNGLTWGTPQYASLVESLITPNDASVQQKLRSVAPYQDVAHFGQNLLNVYQAASNLPVGNQPDWMSAPEILQFGQGDCKNHAILLATLIEALYQNTFGNPPSDLVWVQGGGVGDPNNPGWHVWVLLNLDEIRSVSQDAFNLITNSGPATGTVQEPVGAESPWSTAIQWITVNFDSLPNRLGLLPSQSVLQLNGLYMELEATWKMPIGEFYLKQYPYIAQDLHDQWNSFEYHATPGVIPPGSGSLQVNSNNWHYGDVIRWSASGLSPNGEVSVMVQGTWGTTQLWGTTANPSGVAGYIFTVGTSIQGSGQLIVIDKTTNTFLISNYELLTNVASQTVSPISVRIDVYSIDIGNIGSDPAQQADIGAVMSITFVNYGNTRTVSEKTPFSVVADPFSNIVLSVVSTPSGYRFANEWDDYGVSRYSGAVITLNVLAIIHHKTAAFFNSVQPVSGGGSLQLSSTDWHYGDAITWSAQGLTPNEIVSAEITGTWGTLVLSDTTANANGVAGYSFNVGTNIEGPGQFAITDESTGVTLQTAFSLANQQTTASSLQLNSYTWHYGDTVSWSAEGLTPGAVIQVTVSGLWGSVRFWDVTADASGRAGFSFTVGANVLGSGQFVIVDTATGKVLSIDYMLGQ